MARRLILLLVGLVVLSAGWLIAADGLAGEVQAGEGALVDGAQSPRLDPQAAQAYPGPEATPAGPYPPTSQAIPLISVVLLGALLAIFVVGVCLRYCFRRGR